MRDHEGADGEDKTNGEDEADGEYEADDQEVAEVAEDGDEHLDLQLKSNSSGDEHDWLGLEAIF